MTQLSENGAALVSVAIIAYNQEGYIEECLDSVLAQSYRPLEIVVADDGSTDRTREIISAYAAAYPGVVVPVFADRNGGVTANSTAAHRACTGKYIAWLGGDDIMMPDKIARQVAVMEQDSRIALCYHDLDVFESETGRTLRLFSEMNRPREGDIATAIRYGTFNGGSATMVRRDCTPAEFDARIQIASDWLYWVHCLRTGGRIAYIDAVLGRYRRHSANVTSQGTASRRLLLDHLLTCAILLESIPQHASQIAYSTARLLVGIGRRSERGRIGLFVLAAAVLAGSFGAAVTQLFAGKKERLK